MIPDFKTYIKESIWSDMQERGTGDMVKIEDDVNLLDRDGLYDYLKSHYTLIKPQYKIVNSPSGDSIEVPVFHKIPNVEYIRRWFTKDEVLIPYVFPYLVNGLFPLLAHRYKLKQDITGRYYIISPADSSSVTNKFFLEVIDFITEFLPRESRCVEKMVKESIWSDMQDRGTGDIVKSEDDINLFDIDALYDYIMLHYEGKDENDIAYQMARRIRYSIVICVLDRHRNLHDFVNLYYTLKPDSNDEKQVAILPDVEKKYPDVYQALKQKYDIYYTVEYNNERQTLLGITPKDGGEQSNRFFLEVLDFIIGLNNKYTEVKKVK